MCDDINVTTDNLHTIEFEKDSYCVKNSGVFLNSSSTSEEMDYYFLYKPYGGEYPIEWKYQPCPQYEWKKTKEVEIGWSFFNYEPIKVQAVFIFTMFIISLFIEFF